MNRRERLAELTRTEIKTAAWAQLREKGAGGLSLRGIALEMGVTAPALYRYYPSRNHLVTALILDAYVSFTQAQDQALVHSADPLLALGRVFRTWALANPQAFSLLFGDPIPGYDGPLDEIMTVASGSLKPLLSVLIQARDQGLLIWPIDPPPGPDLAAELLAWSGSTQGVDPDILYLSLVISSRVQGLVLQELGRQLPPFFKDGSLLYERELQRMKKEYFHKT